MNAEFSAKTSPKNSVSFPERCPILWIPCKLYEMTTGGGYNRLAFFSKSTQFTNAHSESTRLRSVRFFYGRGNSIAQSASTRNFRRFSREKSIKSKFHSIFSLKKPENGISSLCTAENSANTQNFSLFHNKKARQYSILRRCAVETAFQTKFHTVSKQI